MLKLLGFNGAMALVSAALLYAVLRFYDRIGVLRWRRKHTI